LCNGAECIVGHTDQPSLFIEGFRFLVAPPRVQDLFICAKDLFIAAIKRKKPQPFTARASWQSGSK